MIDLHVHTDASDGQFSPAQIVRLAKEKGITTIAITDHDTCEGLVEAIEEGKKLGVNIIPGIEVTAFENEEIHVLGYNINYRSFYLKLYKLILNNRLKKEEKVIFKSFKKMGIKLKRKEVKKYSDTKFLVPGDFSQWLIDHGYETDRKTSFQKYFVKGELKDRKKGRMSIKSAIRFIKLLGGIPVLAHPCRISYTDLELENKLDELKKYGLMGVEVYYSTATEQQIQLYKELALKNDLLITMGSDYHGPKIKDYIDLGKGHNNNLEKYQCNFSKNLMFRKR